MRATVDCLDGIGGRVFLMAQSPADTGAGAVSRGRENASLYGGEKEFRLYQTAPDSGKDLAAVATGVFYKALAKDCAARQVRGSFVPFGSASRLRVLEMDELWLAAERAAYVCIRIQVVRSLLETGSNVYA